MAETLVAKPAPPPPIAKTAVMDKKLQKSHGRIGMILFGAILLAGVIYAAMHLFGDLANVHVGSAMPYVLLGLALFIALGFEFVNGFHDTANAVATVIYTHSLEPHIAVAWSGMWNFVGVMLSSSARWRTRSSALLPVELILQVGSGRRLRDGVCAAAGGDCVEPGHVVAGAAGVELAYDDRVDHRGGHGEPVDERAATARRAWTGDR